MYRCDLLYVNVSQFNNPMIFFQADRTCFLFKCDGHCVFGHHDNYFSNFISRDQPFDVYGLGNVSGNITVAANMGESDTNLHLHADHVLMENTTKVNSITTATPVVQPDFGEQSQFL